MSANFETALASYFEGCQRIAAKHAAKYYPGAPRKEWRIDTLKRYVRIVNADSVHSFVDCATGDVLKAAGFKAPAKHARGNIYDESNGLAHMGPYGPAYLR